MNWPTICKYSYCVPLLIGLIVWASGVNAQNLPGNIRIPMGGGGSGGAPAIDDSTKSIYGPKTTEFFFEDDILNGLDSLRYNVDTTLAYFHRWTFVDHDWNRWADLGNLGTAGRPVFFSPRTTTGRQLGFNAYSIYEFKPEEVKYFDTKSPYTDMYYVQGGLNREILKFGFTQNINPLVNFGIRLQRFSSQRQFGSYASRGKAASLAKNWSFLTHGSYFSKNGKYTLLAHLRTFNHSVMEQGGVILADTITYHIGRDDYHGPASLFPGAKSVFRKTAGNLYHQYKLANGFQLFNKLIVERNSNRYYDDQPLTGLQNGVYYADSGKVVPINQTVNHFLLDNKVGIKGELSGYHYQAYFQTRAHNMTSFGHQEDSTAEKHRFSRFEPVLGIRMEYRFKDTTWRLQSMMEHVLGRDLILKGRLDIPWTYMSFQTALTSPDLLMLFYRNRYLSWDNRKDEFRLSKAISFDAGIPLKLGGISFTPDFQWNQLINYLYYNEKAEPEQHAGSFSLMRIGFDSDIAVKRWHFRTLFWYNEGFDNRILRIPRLFFSGEASFAFTYAKALDIQVGLAAHYTSRYYANAYMPMTQQFFVQNKLLTGNYPVVDAFANLRIKRVLLLLKYSHLNHRWLSNGEGYFVTPGYLGLLPAFSIGVRWPLFD